MEIVHRVAFRSSPEDRRNLAECGIDVAGSGFVGFDIRESSEVWPAVQAWVVRRRPSDVVRTNFSKEEVAEAGWLEVEPEWHHGYPQPKEGTFGYREATYDLTEWCELCGIGKKQNAPFQMKREPKWGRKGMLQLNWVFDEYFATPEVWAGVFEPHGVACRPVLNTKKAELATVVQLVVADEVGVVTDGLATEYPTCRKCGRTKYLPVARGRFPPLVGQPSAAAARTVQYFGSGGSAYNRVLVSQDIARALKAAKVRGVSLRPVQGT